MGACLDLWSSRPRTFGCSTGHSRGPVASIPPLWGGCGFSGEPLAVHLRTLALFCPCGALSFLFVFERRYGAVPIPSFAVTPWRKMGGAQPRKGSIRRRSVATEDRGNRRFPAGNVCGRHGEAVASAHSLFYFSAPQGALTWMQSKS